MLIVILIDRVVLLQVVFWGYRRFLVFVLRFGCDCLVWGNLGFVLY